MNTTYFKNAIMGNVFGTKKSPALPSKYYLGLSSTSPNADGTGVTEASGGGYKRLELSNLTAPDNGAIKNSGELQFPESASDWFSASNPATHYVIYDAQTGGNLLIYNSLTRTRIIQANTVATIPAESIVIKLLDA